ncbi:glycosyltransferase family 4 protein [Arthrobacter agilis]|uniref:glycosyltransferase family 4 protein n=1 Tax=Arthrobacter agilis TaxID=37921 RepID=UPI000B35A0A3|nr:glycosyltransferase family 4 protein [Arthrobacter agilis]OUM45601.1 glycosyl transferase family 1 [Arthrobacter agilis]PPB47765.1 glycosyltransferase family 1 protein [Arthrobacter agilis]TPV21655.1 glycosyltransferase family 4 protein [Arthrobacter agilis]VDR32237.1 D-inositol-3-phosphate glycosyltransferase [Arthrobacter agilis]
MHVAYICIDPGIPVFGSKGASVHVQEIVRSWLARGADVTIYCTRTGDAVPADLRGVRVVSHPIARGSGPDRERSQREAAATLAAQAVQDGVTAVYERYSLFSDALTRITSASSVPGILEVNAPLIDEQRTHRTLHDEAAALGALKNQLSAAAVIACVSDPVAAWIAGHAAPNFPTKIITAPNGVNVNRIGPSPEDNGAPTVVFVGTLKPWHGVRDLIEAKALSDGSWNLRIVGDGPEGAGLRELAAVKGVDVEFTGASTPAEVPALLVGCAIAVAPYPRTEREEEQYFSPLKIYEYCAAGLPVVASEVGQVPAIIDHQVTGLLVEPSNPAALAAALDELAGTPLARRTMSVAARRFAENHSWDAVLDAILEGSDL